MFDLSRPDGPRFKTGAALKLARQELTWYRRTHYTPRHELWRTTRDPLTPNAESGGYLDD